MLGFNPYVIMGTAIVILGMSGIITFQYKSNQKLNQTIATQAADLKIATDSIKLLNDIRSQDQKAVNELYLLSKQHELKSTYIKEELERAKNKQAAVLGRPTLVEKMANRATNKVFEEIECVTGNCQ